MNKTLVFLLFAIYMLSCAGTRRSAPPAGDIYSVTREHDPDGKTAVTDSVAYFTRLFDRYCESQSPLPEKKPAAVLQKELEQTAQTVESLLTRRPDTLLAFAFDECHFYALIRLQQRLEQEFHRPSHGYAADGGIMFTFDKNVGGLLPYIQQNGKICRKKTRLVFDVLDRLLEPMEAEKQQRGILALSRMLDKIHIKKSESGYEPFQRSAKGLYLTPGALSLRMEQILTVMAAGAPARQAQVLFEKIKRGLEKPLDRKFVEKMQTSKEMLYLAEKQKDRAAGAGEKSSQKQIFQALTAYEWFEKANKNPEHAKKIDFYNRAIQLDPEFVAAYNNRGNTFLDMDRADAALADYERAVALDTNFYLGYFNIGNIYQSRGMEKRAIGFYNRAVSEGPLYAPAFIHRGQSWDRLKNYDKAIEDYRKALALDSTQTFVRELLGVSYLESGQYQNALALYNRAISKQPDKPLYYNHRGTVYQKTGRTEPAIADFRRAVALDSTYALAWHNLGRMHQEEKRYNPAGHPAGSGQSAFLLQSGPRLLVKAPLGGRGGELGKMSGAGPGFRQYRRLADRGAPAGAVINVPPLTGRNVVVGHAIDVSPRRG